METDVTKLKKGIEFERHWRREYSLFQAAAFSRSIVIFIKELTGVDTVTRFEGEAGWTTATTETGTISNIYTSLGEMLERTPHLVDEHIEKLHQSGEALVAASHPPKRLSKTRFDDLLEHHNRFFSLLHDHGVILFNTFYDVEVAGSLFGKAVALHASPEKVSEIIEFASRPTEKAPILLIAEKFQDEKDLSKRVRFLREKFPWILATDPYTPPPTAEQLHRYAKSFSVEPVSDPTQEPQLPSEIKTLLPLYQKTIHLKDKRDEYRRQANYNVQPLVEELMKKLSITREELWYTLPSELEQFQTDREKILQDIEERKEGYLYEYARDQEVLIQGVHAKEYFVEDETSDVQELKGTVGSRGKAKGKVHIIRSASEISNFPEGYILVATTTNPDYVPAMQKAVAFVTDEGGITCHAAIVAREMKKPAVVGVKNATRVLRDGDVVEVDAEQGIVRKINP